MAITHHHAASSKQSGANFTSKATLDADNSN